MTVTCHVAWLATSIAVDGLLPLATLLGTCTLFARGLVFIKWLLALTLRSRLQLGSKVNVHGHRPVVVSRIKRFANWSFALVFTTLKTWHIELPISSHVQSTISALCHFLRLLQTVRARQSHLQLYLGL